VAATAAGLEKGLAARRVYSLRLGTRQQHGAQAQCRQPLKGELHSQRPKVKAFAAKGHANATPDNTAAQPVSARGHEAWRESVKGTITNVMVVP
jgi:hypothetical protein